MLTTFHTNTSNCTGEVNNFLKNEAEITTDFKTRMAHLVKQIDMLQSGANITYNRIINKLTEAECSGFLSDQSLFMEENY